METNRNRLEPSLKSETTLQDIQPPTFVVGIGASAGGLEALEKLFDRLPADTGMAFVIVQHLSPDFKSFMDEIIRRHTEMAVFRVTDGIEVRRNAVYLIPAGKEMIIAQGRLLLSDKDPRETLTLPIDHFFRSLANDCGANAIAVVLSGCGSDGSRGVRDVHNAGGLVITQDSSSAGFDSMPINSQETGVVDIVGDPSEIANALLKLAKHPMQQGVIAAEDPTVPEDGIKRILREIRDAYGIDFTYYKPSTVVRRIERRLLLNHSDNLEDYVEKVTSDPDEMNLLYKDLLIGVTQFFRDLDAFEILEDRILPDLVSKSKKTDELRIWSAGCATGEEAYTIAILIHERFTLLNLPINVRIFATDVHRASLESASVGVYSDASVVDVSPQRMERYFTKCKEGWKISPDIRNMVVFAPHNLIKDAPFTRMDLITCRNMLIYLQPLAQKKVLSLFHFALRTGGILFLGPSEAVGELAEEFEVIDANWRFSRKRRDIRLPSELRLPPGGGSPTPRRPIVPGSINTKFPIQTYHAPVSFGDRELMGVYDELLADFVPSAFLMNSTNELIHLFGKMNSIIQLPEGRPTKNAMDMLPQDLRTVVIGAIQQANRTGDVVTMDRVRIKKDESVQFFQIAVKKIKQPNARDQYTFVSIQPTQGDTQTLKIAASVDIETIDISDISQERIRILENELRHSRESLQATIEEVESSNEELQATNEEMVASNEELQSTNEELHSVNEELYTVNAEYQKKINELTELGNDMENLLNSTDVHTLFLDSQLAIRKFTSRMGKVFNLIPSDVGREIRGFSHNIPVDDLMGKLREVLADETRYEEEIVMPDGDQYLLRILPYLGESSNMGVVLTLLDTTQSKEAEARFRATFDNAAVGIAHVALDGRWLRVNDRICAILGYNRKELLDKTFADLTFAEDLDLDNQQYESLKAGEIDRYTLEKRYIRKDGELVWISLTVSLQRSAIGEPQFAISVVQDISKRKTFEEGLTEAIAQRDRFLATLSHELRNPLAAVRHALKLFHHPNASPEKQDAAIRTVDRQANQMAYLLDDLLDVSRITQDKIVYEMRPHDFRGVVRDAVDALAPSLEENHHKLNLTLPDSPVVVNGDEARLMQVIENLLTNSCKYTNPGGVVDVTLSSSKQACWLEIRDNGRGIEPEMLETVFDMFVQSDGELARRDGGMGLGLTVVKSLVDRHGGSIAVDSDGVGKGATFTLTLPLSKLPVEDASREVDRRPAIRRDGGLIPMVLVEDNEDAREMLTDFLELEGFEVTACADGEEGLKSLIELQPSLALVDIGLPVLNGYEVAEQFRQRCPDSDVYLIALSGYGQTGDIVKSEAAGFNSHLTKPVDPDELLAILNEL